MPITWRTKSQADERRSKPQRPGNNGDGIEEERVWRNGESHNHHSRYNGSRVTTRQGRQDLEEQR